MDNSYFILICFWTYITTVHMYKTCTGSLYRSQHYTYAIDPDTGEQVWSHCMFPTPIHDHILCGRPAKDGNYFLCDPDGMLDAVAHDVIDQHLCNIQTNTSTLCTAPSGERQSFISAMLIINRIRIPDLRSPLLCLNDCNELQPLLRTEEDQTLTDEEQYEILRNFADSVRQLWSLGACENDVIILYCKQFDKIYISAGHRASKHLSNAKISTMMEVFDKNLHSGDFQTGLLVAISNLANTLRIVLRATTIAHALIISNLVVVFLFGAWFFYYLFIRKLETNVWGQEKPFQFLEWVVQAVTGIWFIKNILIALTAVSNSKAGLIYAFIGAGFAFVMCFAMYGIGGRLYHG